MSKYSEAEQVEAGLRFRTPSGSLVETTGGTQYVETTKVYVHEVKVVEGTGEGETFLHNLDYSQPA